MQVRFLLCMVAFTVYAAIVQAETEGGLILSGQASIHSPHEKGFDFVTQEVCTVYADNACVTHIYFQYYGPAGKYVIFVLEGYGMRTEATNLDSIKFAPADSILTAGKWGRVDSIPPDSLSDYIGNVYVIKTGTDPRDKRPYYAKLKILDFNVIDAGTHEVEMVFLWAVNLSGPTDLRTANLDTFDLTTVARRERNDAGKGRGADAATWRGGDATRLRFAVSGSGVRVVGPGIVGRAERVWDLRGRARVFTRRAE